MFRGSIPVPAQQITRDTVRLWDPETPIQVLCSGNLTVERSIASLDRKVYGNDVTIYSCALGAAAAKQPFRCRVNKKYEKNWGWLNDYLPEDNPHRCAATIIQVSEWATVFDKPGHLYFARMAKAATHQWDMLVDKTEAKYKSNLPKLVGFRHEGALEVLESTPKDHAIVTYPPFYGNDYESLFSKLHRIFDWDRPDYIALDEAGRDAMLEKVTSFKDWLIAVPLEYGPLMKHRFAVTKTTNRGVPIHFYASRGRPRVVMPHQTLEALPYPTLLPDEDIKGPLVVTKLSLGQFAQLRSQYMNMHIAPGQPNEMFAVLCGGKLVGAFAYNAALTTDSYRVQVAMRGKIGNSAYILSDFPIAPTKYDRMAKLILYVALSREVKGLLEDNYGRLIDSACTTAFTDRPASMKYRGLFKLLSRREDHEEVGKHRHRYQLNYWQTMGQWNLTEAFEIWQRKHGSKLRSKPTTPANS